MTLSIPILASFLAGIAALFSLLAFFAALRARSHLTPEVISGVLRNESEQIRRFGDEQARGLRQELGENLARFQETTVRELRELRDGLDSQVKEFDGKLDAGVVTIHDRVADVAVKLDKDIARMGEEAARNRDALRQTIEAKLDDASLKQSTAARESRDEMTGSFRKLGASISETLAQVSDHQKERLQNLATAMSSLSEKQERAQEALRQTVEAKLDDSSLKQSTAARESREEITGSFGRLSASISELLGQVSDHQKERLENVTMALSSLSEKQERAQEALKQTVENRLEAIRVENASKLDEIRGTVDEKLQSTLDSRLGESFNRVVEHLERVQRGIGEMQTLAAGVGDLKKVLSNVRVRGTFGEVQLEALLQQLLSPEQYIKNAQIKEDSQERVEFAIRLPGRDSSGDVLLPVDAKFPQEDYERLVAASEIGDATAVGEASKALENRIRLCARSIREKYIATPRTTEFAILFLPTESLYAEILRRPGLFEQLQRESHVVLTGPTTFTALLNALQMGFRSLAIEKRSSEVWKILGAVGSEFARYNNVVDQLSRQLGTAAKTVEKLGVRTRAMNRRLRDVEKLPDDEAQIVLGPALAVAEEEEEDARILAEEELLT